MKGFVKVTTTQLEEAIAGFTKRFNEGKLVRDMGVEKFHKRFYTDDGGLWIKFRCRKMTPSQFVYYHMGAWSRISDVIFKVLSEEEQEKLEFWQWRHMSYLDGFKAMVSQSVDGFALVDSGMAKEIQTYRGFL